MDVVVANTAANTLDVSFYDARLWAILATVVSALVAGGFLIPWFKRRRARRTGDKADRLGRGPGAQSPATQQRIASLNAQQSVAEAQAQTPAAALFLGSDGRLSTSTTIAWMWTIVIFYVIAALIIAWPRDWATPFTHFDGTYIALLGGPYASWVLAKAAVGTKVKNLSLQKPAGDGTPRLSDLVQDDTGNADLFDIQYVMFNVAAMAFVLIAFFQNSGAGFPVIPPALVILTAGPAAVYLSNKALSSNPPSISAVTPTVLGPGTTFTVTGQNFTPAATSTPQTVGDQVVEGGTEPTALQVLVGDIEADITSSSNTSIVACLPATYPPPTAAGPLPVKVVSTGGQTALWQGATVKATPQLVGFDRQQATVGYPLTISGSWTDPNAVPLYVVFDENIVIAVTPSPTATSTQATITVPEVNVADQGSAVAVALQQSGLTSTPVNLTIVPAPAAPAGRP